MRHSDVESWDFIQQRAAYLIINRTPAEDALLQPLTALGFRFQWPLMLTGARGRKFYIICDYYHDKLKLIVEVDGSSHRKKKGKDARRDRAAAFNGITTIRISNKEALRGDLTKIKEAMEG